MLFVSTNTKEPAGDVKIKTATTYFVRAITKSTFVAVLIDFRFHAFTWLFITSVTFIAFILYTKHWSQEAHPLKMSPNIDGS